MIRCTGCSTDDSNGHIAELVIELGGLPLALEQAGAHIKALKCTFKQYIERFKKKRLKLLRPLRDKSIDASTLLEENLCFSIRQRF
jgi:hypothetical protein